MKIQTLNITLMSAGNALLCLHHFQVVGYSGGEAVLRLGKCLLRQINGAAGHFYLFGSRVKIKQSGAYLIVDTATKITKLRTSLLQLGIRLEDVTVNPVAGEDRNRDAAIHLPGTVGLARVDPDISEIRIHIDAGITSRRGRLARQFRRSYLSQRCLIVGARSVGTLQICVDGESG